MFRRASAIAAALTGGAAVFAAPAKSFVCTLAPPPGASPEAGPKGTVTFTQRQGDARVTVRVRASGVPPGMHGFHIHALGDLTQGCSSAGGHFNPKNGCHGGPGDQLRHAGDLGNVEASGEGIVDATIVDDQISLDAASAHSILGRSVVLHADQDDLGRGGFPDSLTTGHAGARIACGVIGLAADVEVA